MDEKKSEVDELFDGLPSEDKKAADIFEAPEKEAPKEEEKELEPRKNREFRRLEAKYQAERESSIALAERLKVLSETERFRQDLKTDDVPTDWLSIYGGTTPEGQEQAKRAWKLQREMLDSVKQEAKEEALREIEEREVETKREQAKYESFIEDQLEAIEDEFNVDVTSDAPSARKARREFLEMVQKFSPKDEDGNISDYADFGATWGQYQATRKKPDNSKQKDLADRTMTPSGNGADQEKKVTPGFRGWMKDLNV
jgi:hypothetical protein